MPHNQERLESLDAPDSEEGIDVSSYEGLTSLMDQVKEHYQYIENHLSDPAVRQAYYEAKVLLDATFGLYLQQEGEFSDADMELLEQQIRAITDFTDAAEATAAVSMRESLPTTTLADTPPLDPVSYSIENAANSAKAPVTVLGADEVRLPESELPANLVIHTSLRSTANAEFDPKTAVHNPEIASDIAGVSGMAARYREAFEQPETPEEEPIATLSPEEITYMIDQLDASADQTLSPEQSLAAELAKHGQYSLEPDQSSDSFTIDPESAQPVLAQSQKRRTFTLSNEVESPVTITKSNAITPEMELLQTDPKPSESDPTTASAERNQPSEKVVVATVDQAPVSEYEAINRAWEDEESGDSTVTPEKKVINPQIAAGVEKIEAAGMDYFYRVWNEYQSPYEVLADVPFTTLQKQAAAGVGTRGYNELKSLLEERQVKYEVFSQWVDLFPEIDQLGLDTQHMTFKEVVDAYLMAKSTR